MSRQTSSDFTILRINSQAKWKAGRIAADNLIIGEDGLRLQNFSEYGFNRVIGKPQGLVEPTDLAVDRCGQLFILDGQQSRIAMYDPQQDRLEWIERIGGTGDLPTQLKHPEAIAVTDRSLYVADTGNRRLLTFARINWQVRWIVEPAEIPRRPADVIASPPDLNLPIEPCDLAVDADENLYVLDCANCFVQKFDAGGCFVSTIGQGWLAHPVTIAIDNTSRGDIPCLLQHIRAGDNRERFAGTLFQLLNNAHNKLPKREQDEFSAALATVATGTWEERLRTLYSQLQRGVPTAIEIVETRIAPLVASYQTLLYVLDREVKRVLKFTGAGEFLGVTIDLNRAGLGFLDPFGLAVDQQGHIYIGDRHALPQGEDEDRFIYKFDAVGKLMDPPITAYRGRTDGLVTDQKFNLYVLNVEREDITILKAQEKSRLQGVYIAKAFDSTIADCQWHKLVVDSTIPEKTQIKVSYFISVLVKSDGEIASLSDNEWLRLPLPNPQDALILSPTGRYLWLRVELSGDGTSSPVVHSVEVYFQRISYLRYLPAVYQENESSRIFLERFLSLFETFFYGLELKISEMSKLFDPQATPGAFLPWLAQWLAAAFDENWPQEKQRRFLRRAATLYKARGTRRGFEEIIELFTGEKPIIFEFFQLRCVQDSEVRKLYETIFGDDPFHFCILLKPTQVSTEGEYLAIKRIVEADKPAHTHGGVRLLQPWMYLNMHTYLGINTYLQKPEMRLEQQSVVGRDSVLTDRDEAGQVECRSRLNIDTTIT
jgi:phage tail-like protein